TRKSEIEGEIIMTGGGALNVGLHKAFEDELMADIHVANRPQFNGSLGAALISKERAEKANVKRIG
ncbi:MAG: rod shape-determining protein, partial [Bacillota bacterium]